LKTVEKQALSLEIWERKNSWKQALSRENWKRKQYKNKHYLLKQNWNSETYVIDFEESIDSICEVLNQHYKPC